MNQVTDDIRTRLQQDIWRMQGQRPAKDLLAGKVALGPILEAFPHKVFPTGAVHECITKSAASTAATTGFVAGILSGLMHNSGPCVWISPAPLLFPPGFCSFGVEPDRLLFVQVTNEKERCWAMETCLQMEGLSAVVSELPDLSFTSSRRLQLAVEKTGVTGFILRTGAGSPQATACTGRWQITPLASYHPNGMPGVGFPCWNVELQKIRGGKPGTWQLLWMDGRFQERPAASVLPSQTRWRKIG